MLISSSEQLLSYLELLQDDYRDLQPATIDVLESPMDGIRALRMIHKSHPAVVRDFKPTTSDFKWDLSSLLTILGEKEVSIAITDDGLADSVRYTDEEAGEGEFVKPLEERMVFRDFLSRLLDPEGEEVFYLQSQDGNIYRKDSPANEFASPELEALQGLVERDIPWMKEALGVQAEAVNLWIGDERSTTSLHHDPYENVYHVLAGRKKFTLVSPMEGFKLQQHFHPSFTLTRDPHTAKLTSKPDVPPTKVPWISGSTMPPSISPIIVDLGPGETLFLPSGWWHRVEQVGGEEGVAVAINYWYPSELNAEKYAYERLARRIARLAGREGVIPVPGDEDAGSDVWASGAGSGSEGEEWEPSDWGR